MIFRILVSALLLTLPAFAQDVHIEPRKDPNPPKVIDLPGADETMKKKVNLALIPVSVVDPEGRPFLGLQAGHFKLLENGKEVPITSFSISDAPCSIGIIFDHSGSMGGKLEISKEAVRQLMGYSNPQDEYFLVSFAETIEMTGWTNGEGLAASLSFTASKGQTSLLDAIVKGLDMMETAHYQRRALIVITDGGDNHSRYTENEVKHMVEEAGVSVFALGVIDVNLSRPNPNSASQEEIRIPEGSITAEELRGPFLLENIALASGGMLYVPYTISDIPQAAQYIGQLLRTQYTLGYKPQHMKDDGKFRKIKVELRRLPKGTPALRVQNVQRGIYARVGEDQ